MKSITLLSTMIMLMLILVSCLVFFSSCKPDGPSPLERNRKILTGGTWQIESVSVDGVDRSSYFDGMTLTFTTNQYQTVNGDPVWPASGTWSFSDDDGMVISRDGQITVRIISLNAATLELELDWEDTTLEEGGRTSSIPGPYIFKFRR